MTSVQPQKNSQDPPEDGQRGRKSLGEGFAQVLHDRAWQSAQQLSKLLLSLSTAILAVYFLGLTTKIEPELTNWQVAACIAGLVSMGIATVVGILGLWADTKRNYLRASALQATIRNERDRLIVARNHWLKYKRWCNRLLGIFFVTGIAASVAYLVLRVINQ